MNILIVHQNFPGQYRNLARYLGASGAHNVIFISQRENGGLPGVRTMIYRPHRRAGGSTHGYLRGTEQCVLNGQAVARVALALRSSGFIPHVILGHNAWGEIWYMKDIFPNVPLLGYFEFFYRAEGADVGFDSPMPTTIDMMLQVRTKNLGNLMGLDVVDRGQTPTWWQKSTYPEPAQTKLDVLHEGVNTGLIKPDRSAVLEFVPAGASERISLRAGDEVVTYVARNLEPYRGFHYFMRSLPEIMRRRPAATVLVVGGDDVSYGQPAPGGGGYRELLLRQLGETIDTSRVHFLGRLPYGEYLKVLQVSRVHVYLSYPFVLSWSMLEAMSAGCLVIGSRTPPVEEVIEHGKNGILVEFSDTDAIAGEVVSALTDPVRHDALRAEARQTVIKRYDLQSICLPLQMQWLAKSAGLAIAA